MLGQPGLRVGEGAAFPLDPLYASAGNHILFADPGLSEDFIGYKNNTFYFADSVGGGDEVQPDVAILGNVGIGTASLTSKISILTPDGTDSSKSEQFPHALAITTGIGARTLWFGYDNTMNAGYINAAGDGNIRPILLQSRGGAVAINTSTPDMTKALHVNGAVRIDGTVTLSAPGGGISMGIFTAQ